jgi:hypothetical protein
MIPTPRSLVAPVAEPALLCPYFFSPSPGNTEIHQLVVFRLFLAVSPYNPPGSYVVKVSLAA